jgi:hypothetical protein
MYAIPDFKVNDGATIAVGSDCYPVTIVKINYFKTGNRAGQLKSVEVQDDKVIYGNYDLGTLNTFEPNPNGEIETFVMRKNGRLENEYGTSLWIGKRRYYQDPSF